MASMRTKLGVVAAVAVVAAYVIGSPGTGGADGADPAGVIHEDLGVFELEDA